MDCSPPGSFVWDSSGKNTGVGWPFLLQGIFPDQISNPHSTSPTLVSGFFTTEPPGKSPTAVTTSKLYWVNTLHYSVPWRGKWQPTPVFLPGKFDGWRSLVSYRDCRITHDWATSQCSWPSGSFPSECFRDPAYFCLVVLLAASSELSPCSLQTGKETFRYFWNAPALHFCSSPTGIRWLFGRNWRWGGWGGDVVSGQTAAFQW